jgi:hypothetical protein
MILGETECMHCKHPQDDDPELGQAKQLASVFGLNVETWFNKISENKVFTTEEVERIKSRFEGIETAFDFPRPGERFQDWNASQCGKLKLQELEEEFPIPFAPVMAGVLLAGEVIKEHLYSDDVLKSYYWNSLTARFNPLAKPRMREANRNCEFCRDQTMRDQYERSW